MFITTEKGEEFILKNPKLFEEAKKEFTGNIKEKFKLPTIGDSIIIKSKEYEVVSIREEADYVEPPYIKIRMYFAIYLHKIGSKALHPTDCLSYYSDTNKFKFFTIEQPKPPKWLKHPRQRGHLTSFKDSGKINQKDIKIKK